MEAKSFRVAGLSSCYHTQETMEIFERCMDNSITESVTSAMVKYAEKLGFGGQISDDMVNSVYLARYISSGRLVQIQGLVDRSRKKDYTYLVAFEFLQWIRPGVSKSLLQRDAISKSCC